MRISTALKRFFKGWLICLLYIILPLIFFPIIIITICIFIIPIMLLFSFVCLCATLLWPFIGWKLIKDEFWYEIFEK